jgi:hypothetical protein
MASTLNDDWVNEYNQLVTLVTNSQGAINDARDAALAAQTAAQASATTAANDAAQAGTQLDTALATAFDSLTSVFRAATDAAYAAKSVQDEVDSGRLSIDSMKAYALESDLQPIQDAVNTGRLSATALDSRYNLAQPQQHAVFIGSSNALPGEWIEDFCTFMGYTPHIFSVGGGGFTAGGGQGVGSFNGQIQAAIADTSYPHDKVTKVFICDMGNDIRATNSITPYVSTVMAQIAGAYVNAETIILPAVWGNAPGNNISGCITSISRRWQELINEIQPFRARAIPYSWLWNADSGDWMKPGEVHCNTAGYQRLSNFMKKYMIGGNVRYDIGKTLVPVQPAVFYDSSYWTVSREGNDTHLEGTFTVQNAVGLDVPLGQLPYGTWPIGELFLTVIGVASRASYNLVIYGVDTPNAQGLIRSYQALPADTYIVNATWKSY